MADDRNGSTRSGGGTDAEAGAGQALTATELDAYRHLRDFESEFDQAQGNMRQTASLWVLAGFGGLAYAFFAIDPGGSTALKFMLAFAVCWLSFIGIYLLWLMDQAIYQRLLHSVFVHGLYLESLNPALPQVRSSMYRQNLNVSWKLTLFYVGPMTVFLICGILIRTQLDMAPVSISGRVLLGATAVEAGLGLMSLIAVAAAAHVVGAMLRPNNRLIAYARLYGDDFVKHLR